MQFRLRSLFILLVLAACAMQFARPVRETRLAEKLEAPAKVRWDQKPFDQAMEELAAKHGIQIQLDERGLVEEGIAKNTPVLMRMSTPVELGKLLKHVLEPLRLDYCIRQDRQRGQYVLVTSEYFLSHEYSQLHTDPIDVTDLVSTPAELAELADFIQRAAAPRSWEAVGGRGSIVCSDSGMSLVVTQTQDALFDVRDVLDQLWLIKARDVAERYLIELSLDSTHPPGVWQVSLLPTREPGETLEPGDEFILRNRSLEMPLARRVEAILYDADQLSTYVEERALYAEPPEYYELRGELRDIRIKISLREISTVWIYRPDRPVVQLELTDSAVAKLRGICERALAATR